MKDILVQKVSLFLFLIANFCLNQLIFSQESITNYPNGIIKEEISSFVRKTEIGEKPQILSKELEEYKIYNCSDKHVTIHNNNHYRIISIYAMDDTTKKASSSKLVTNVIYLHMKSQLVLPSSAYENIYAPRFCISKSIGKRKESKRTKNITYRYTKAFGSKDGKRVYIYMHNGNETSQYEVTWIIENGKYIGRIIDNL
jgi:hypothetical protein